MWLYINFFRTLSLINMGFEIFSIYPLMSNIFLGLVCGYKLLYCTLEVEIFVKQSDGFKVKGKVNWVCVLIRVWENSFLQNLLERWGLSVYINSFVALSLINVGIDIFSIHPLHPILFWIWCMNVHSYMVH